MKEIKHCDGFMVLFSLQRSFYTYESKLTYVFDVCSHHFIQTESIPSIKTNFEIDCYDG